MSNKIYNDGEVQGALMDVPGFRFHPTEEELVGFYLRKKAQSDRPLIFDIIIPTLDLYRYEPWELPGLAHDVGEKQWFFFVPRAHGKSLSRPNRLTVSGFWKATGADRAVRNGLLQCIGLKKTLVFYQGKFPGAQKTDWIMNEYRLPDFSSFTTKKNMDIVLCRIYRKAISWKSMEQRAKPNHVERENPVFSPGDRYEDNPSNSFTLNGSFQLSDEMPETGLSSIHYDNQEGECSDLSKRNDEHSLFDCLEPIMCFEETMVLKTPKACKPSPLELPTLSMDCLFSSPSTDNLNAWTPYALLSNPSLSII